MPNKHSKNDAAVIIMAR